MGAWGSQVQISPAVSWGLYISRCRSGAFRIATWIALPIMAARRFSPIGASRLQIDPQR
jgi:hypothetical protein